MPLTRLDNLLSSKTGKYLYVSPDDFNASDALDNRGNSPTRPFVTIQRAFLEAARFSYLPDVDNDRFDQFTIMLSPGNHYIDNRPGVDTVEELPVFQFNQSTGEWESNTNVIFDLGNPNNILYKFNGRDGGATIPRGTSLVGMDLRRTQVRPLYVPDPADKDVPRCALFNVTGGCYFWQFTILDGDLTSSSPLYDQTELVGKVYTQPKNTTNLAVPEFSHHKITNFVFADKQDLGLLYRKISRVFSDYQPTIDDVYVEGSTAPVTENWSGTTNYSTGSRVIYDGKAYEATSTSLNVRPDSDATKWNLLVIRGREFDFRVQENRIVGPLSDAVRIDSIKIDDGTGVNSGIATLTVRTKINHGFFPGQYVAVSNTGLNTTLNGVFKVSTISQTDPKEFTYRVPATATGLGLTNGLTYTSVSAKPLDNNATVQAEVDSVESASPYVFNVSIRSTWGICGIWADGRKATGFKSMVIAQYTGVSLQKDDRAFIRYDEFSNTWNQAPLTDAFATTPYHIKGDAYWKDDWRNFHVKASDDSFIQCVSIFAVGFADHFLMESGGDMSITNSNSNFGNTSLHAIGYKGFAFNQDKGGYVTDIIPPKSLTTLKTLRQQYYTLSAELSRRATNTTKLYLGSEDARDPADRPSGSVDGYRLGARRNDKIFVKLDPNPAYQAELSQTGFKRWSATASTLNPTGSTFTTEYNLNQDAANLIDSNKEFIQSEAFGYILEKYPYLQNRSYINPNITSETGRYRDGSNLIKSNKTEIVDYAYAQMRRSFFTAITSTSTSPAPTLTSVVRSGTTLTITTSGNHSVVAGDIIKISGATQTDYNGTFAVLSTPAATSTQFSVSLPNPSTSATTATGSITVSVPFLVPGVLGGDEAKAKRDLENVVIAIADDLYDGGNSHIIDATKSYFNSAGVPISTGLVGEEVPAVFAFNRVKDWCKKAISNQLTNTSLLKVTALTRSGATVTVEVDPLYPHGLRAGDYVTVGGARETAYNGKFQVLSTDLTPTQFKYTAASTPSASPATGSYYVSTITIDPENDDVETGRYKDASNLITLNRQEIIDRSVAKIAVDFPDFYYPGDPQTTSVSRFKDAYRLIQKNKDIIAETALTAINTLHPTFVYPGADSAEREANKVKCRRDIGHFIDAVSLDIAQGDGNKYTRQFLLQYFDNSGVLISNGLSGEVAQSNTAFTIASEVMKAAITNTLTSSSTFAESGNPTPQPIVTSSPFTGSWLSGSTSTGLIVYQDITITPDPVTGSNTNSASCANVQTAIDNLTTIVTSRLTSGNINGLNAITETVATSTAGEGKCRRDVGYIVDAIAQDLFWGGNEFIIGSTREYFSNVTTISSTSLAGEVSQSIAAFTEARNLVKKAITNQLYVKNLNISAGPATAGGTGGNIPVSQSGNAASCADVQTTAENLFQILLDALNAGRLTSNTSSGGSYTGIPTVNNGTYDCANVRSTIDTLTSIITSSVSEGNLNSLPARNIGQWSQISDNSKCKRDIGYIVEAITADLRLGSNENTINAAEAYYTAVTLVSDTTDGRQDGFTLDYIENEKNETLDAYRFVRDLAISSMRNHNTYIANVSTDSGSPVLTLPSTVGLVIGMKVRSVNTIPTNASTAVTFTSVIPDGAYIKRIGDGTNGLTSNQIELGTSGSRFNLGTVVNATTTSTVNIFVEYKTPVWSTSKKPVVDSTVIQDYGYNASGSPASIAPGATGPGGECASVASSIVNFYQIISTIINSGVGTIPRVSSTLNTASLAQRATLFTLVESDSTGAPTTNPHNLETGTPIRLVPRAKAGVDVDKKLIRLPKGFETNRIYYTIAPSRITSPFDYSNTIGFNGANQQNLMLATSEENAAAGIYIYSSETDTIDPNVEIDVYQYVLDINYDLHQYQTKISSDRNTELETTRPHIFDVTTPSTEPQKVFFRTGADIPGGSSLPIISGAGGAIISTQIEYYARYVSSNRFTIHTTKSDAESGLNPVIFATPSSAVFYTFASKRRSPLKFDPTIEGGSTGCWYLDTISATNTIIPRIKQASYTQSRTSDTYFERIEDNRTKEDRIYRLRYVIPKELTTVRDPLRGFVIKARTDERRRLLPQKILLKPTNSATTSTTLATFFAPGSGEPLGRTKTELLTLNSNYINRYDPYLNGKKVETESKVTFTIQSARQKNIDGKNYIELTVFDITTENNDYKTKIFTTVKISAPQGGSGSFVSNVINLPSNNTTTDITWSGKSSGSARVHAYFAFEGNYYMILKDLSGNSFVDYDPNNPTIFTQGSTTATLLDQPNGGRSDIDNFLYVVDGANVYTMTPGDRLNDDNGVSWTIASVEDTKEVNGTFYIFDINTIRRRIPGQQDGVYYLTCIRGDISPFPVGSGVGDNFRNFRFSQPVSKIYPEFYKNDPEWYKGIDSTTTTLKDPPATISSADNYIHGLVTVNDSKNNLTKETIIDFVGDPGLKNQQFTGANAIEAQPGSASAGSEGRRIPISGNSEYPLEDKFYVELRRPSIARSGNHTFEYLGFGPGNYSTGFPARQEVVLTDVQDFYAQAKRQDAGIVFYTGLNSNGDLYIGNRKINAITGEETFLEKAVLSESADDSEEPDTSLVTVFEDNVTFRKTITVEGDNGRLASTFTSPVRIENPTADPTNTSIPNPDSLTIVNGAGTGIGYDETHEVNPITGARTGNIVLHQNRINSAVVALNTRGLQSYTLRTAISNVTPDLANTFGNTTGGPTQLENTDFGTRLPLRTGDLQFKGKQTLFSGSLGWIYATDYVRIENRVAAGISTEIVGIQGNPTDNKLRLNWNTLTGTTNQTLKIGSGTQIRITGAVGSLSPANGVWPVVGPVNGSGAFDVSASYVEILINERIPEYSVIPLPNNGYPVDAGPAVQPTIAIERSESAFKEWGVIGAEALRTKTVHIGDYKLGINTVARSAHSDYQNAFVSSATDPRANLDVVGTAFISGKVLSVPADSVPSTTGNNNFLANINLSARSFQNVDNAFLIGGDSSTPNNLSTVRVMTTNNGRFGINTTNNGTAATDLDRTLTVIGDSRITSTLDIGGNTTIGTSASPSTLVVSGDTAVNGSNLTTTNTNFNLINANATTVNFANAAVTFTGLNSATSLKLANTSTASGTTATATATIGGGFVTGFTITNGGSGYTTPPPVRIVGGGGSGATAVAVINAAGVVTSITRLSFGTGYTTAPTVVIGAPGQTIEIGNAASGQTLTIGSSATTSVLSIHPNSNNSEVSIGVVNSTAGSARSLITMGGAFGNPPESIFNIKNAQTILNGNLEVLGGQIQTNAATFDLLTRNGTAGTVNAFTRATNLNLASVSGTTRINNNLNVLGDASFNGDVVINGGLNTGELVVTRGALGSTPQAHPAGTIFALNVDYYRTIEFFAGGILNPAAGTTFTTTGTSVVATGTYGTSASPLSPTTVTGAGFGARLIVQKSGTSTSYNGSITITVVDGGLGYRVGDQLLIPGNLIGGATPANDLTIVVNGLLSTSTTVRTDVDTAGVGNLSATTTDIPIAPTTVGINIGDYLLIDDEIVEVVGAPTISSPYIVPVRRGVECTTPAIHADNAIIRKLERFTGATFANGVPTAVGGSIPNAASGSSTTILVGQFSGNPQANDYLRINPTSVCPSGEFVRITGVNNSDSEDFRINNGAGADKFVVDSTTGATTVSDSTSLGGLTVWGPLSFRGNCSSSVANRSFTLRNTVDDTFVTDMCNGNTKLAGTFKSVGYALIGGNFKVRSGVSMTSDSGVDRFSVDAATGNTSVDGTLTVGDNITGNGTGINVLAGSLRINLDLQVNGGDLLVNRGNPWVASTAVALNSFIYSGSVTYRVTTAGTTGTAAPTHSAGVAANGTAQLTVWNHFRVKNDGRVDLGGVDNYFNANGGLKWVYIPTPSNTEASIDLNIEGLRPNTNYFVRPTGTNTQLILRLPADAITGDMIRIIDIGGQISNNCQLVVRAPGTGVRIQNDSTGSMIGIASPSPAYASGELIVNTPKAAFTLVFMGNTDANGLATPGGNVGWHLLEV